MLKGDKVILRAMRREDLELYNSYKNDIEIGLLASDDPPAPFELPRTVAAFDAHVASSNRLDTVWFAIEAQSAFIGQCLLRDFDYTARTCEVGITIGERDYWGRGYGRDAMRLLCKYAFRLRNMEKVWLTVAGTNERGIRSYKACGFAEEGRLKRHIWLDGVHDDLVYMGIFREDWQAAQNQLREGSNAANEA